ncbi:hypothetical protein HJG60_005239 [Phyllostomus discolor]|uniref:Uncharacterized protein n=1 Tax=Phyllostomus discolor TaxID=89673 RepID=A0A834AD73_9CHIR|nr:hypothetical protein HJG60_005239 [Phyllostomus discolor]
MRSTWTLEALSSTWIISLMSHYHLKVHPLEPEHKTTRPRDRQHEATKLLIVSTLSTCYLYFL